MEQDYLVYTYNRFQACRFGLDGQLVHPQSYATRSLREDIAETLRSLQPETGTEADGPHPAARHLMGVLHHGSDASQLRAAAAESGGAEGMTTLALARFRGDADA